MTTRKETWITENDVEVDAWYWGPEAYGPEAQVRVRSEFGDKAEWGEGDWTTEPDKLSWTDPNTGMPCLIVRGPAGALCGYVGVTEGHPLFGNSEPYEIDVDVHGGLTYGDACFPSDDEGRHICHVPKAGESDHVWWLGFDCAHAFDFAPGMEWTVRQAYLAKGEPVPECFSRNDYNVYRNVAYVMSECASLAAQLSPLQIGTGE